MGREAILLGLGEDFASPGQGRSDKGTMPLCLAVLVTISITEGPFTCHTNLPPHTSPLLLLLLCYSLCCLINHTCPHYITNKEVPEQAECREDIIDNRYI